jgi:hypothetical protein
MPALASDIDPTSDSSHLAGEGMDMLNASMRLGRTWEVARDRQARHAIRDRMDTSALISKALDVIADVATAPEDDETDARSSFEISCEDTGTLEAAERIAKALKLKEVSWGIARRCAQFGNEMRELVPDAAERHIARYKLLPEQEMWYRTDAFGLPVMPQPWEQRAYYQPEGDGIPFYEWQIVHYKYGDEDSTYGVGILQCEREWEQLTALQESMVFGRLKRSPSRLLHLIPVDPGKGAPEIRRTLQKYKQDYTRSRLLNDTIGTISRDRPTQGPDDIFMPYYGEAWKGAGVTQLDPSNTQLTNIRDVEYHRAMVLARLGVPVRYLNMGGAEAVRASLGSGGIAHEDRQFARTIRRLQSVLAEGHHRVLLFGLILEGENPVAHPVEIGFPVISTEDALANAKVEKTRAETMAIISKELDLPPSFVHDRYLRLSAEEKDAFEQEIQLALQRKTQGDPDPLRNTEHLREIAAATLVMAEETARRHGIELHLQRGDSAAAPRDSADGADYALPSG